MGGDVDEGNIRHSEDENNIRIPHHLMVQGLA
jgi:hypothetical protein